MKHLVNEQYPDAVSIRWVPDNLNTHTPEAFYEYFEPAKARRFLDTLAFHFISVMEPDSICQKSSPIGSNSSVLIDEFLRRR